MKHKHSQKNRKANQNEIIALLYAMKSNEIKLSEKTIL